MTTFKIRNRHTGEFSTGGMHPAWHPTAGKSWKTIGHVKAHLTAVREWASYYPSRKDMADVYLNAIEVVEYRLAEVGVRVLD